MLKPLKPQDLRPQNRKPSKCGLVIPKLWTLERPQVVVCAHSLSGASGPTLVCSIDRVSQASCRSTASSSAPVVCCTNYLHVVTVADPVPAELALVTPMSRHPSNGQQIDIDELRSNGVAPCPGSISRVIFLAGFLVATNAWIFGGVMSKTNRDK